MAWLSSTFPFFKPFFNSFFTKLDASVKNYFDQLSGHHKAKNRNVDNKQREKILTEMLPLGIHSAKLRGWIRAVLESAKYEEKKFHSTFTNYIPKIQRLGDSEAIARLLTELYLLLMAHGEEKTQPQRQLVMSHFNALVGKNLNILPPDLLEAPIDEKLIHSSFIAELENEETASPASVIAEAPSTKLAAAFAFVGLTVMAWVLRGSAPAPAQNEAQPANPPSLPPQTPPANNAPTAHASTILHASSSTTMPADVESVTNYAQPKTDLTTEIFTPVEVNLQTELLEPNPIINIKSTTTIAASIEETFKLEEISSPANRFPNTTPTQATTTSKTTSIFISLENEPVVINTQDDSSEQEGEFKAPSQIDINASAVLSQTTPHSITSSKSATITPILEDRSVYLAISSADTTSILSEQRTSSYLGDKAGMRSKVESSVPLTTASALTTVPTSTSANHVSNAASSADSLASLGKKFAKQNNVPYSVISMCFTPIFEQELFKACTHGTEDVGKSIEQLSKEKLHNVRLICAEKSIGSYVYAKAREAENTATLAMARQVIIWGGAFFALTSTAYAFRRKISNTIESCQQKFWKLISKAPTAAGPTGTPLPIDEKTDMTPPGGPQTATSPSLNNNNTGVSPTIGVRANPEADPANVDVDDPSLFSNANDKPKEHKSPATTKPPTLFDQICTFNPKALKRRQGDHPKQQKFSPTIADTLKARVQGIALNVQGIALNNEGNSNNKQPPSPAPVADFPTENKRNSTATSSSSPSSTDNPSPTAANVIPTDGSATPNSQLSPTSITSPATDAPHYTALPPGPRPIARASVSNGGGSGSGPNPKPRFSAPIPPPKRASDPQVPLPGASPLVPLPGAPPLSVDIRSPTSNNSTNASVAAVASTSVEPTTSNLNGNTAATSQGANPTPPPTPPTPNTQAVIIEAKKGGVGALARQFNAQPAPAEVPKRPPVNRPAKTTPRPTPANNTPAESKVPSAPESTPLATPSIPTPMNGTPENKGTPSAPAKEIGRLDLNNVFPNQPKQEERPQRPAPGKLDASRGNIIQHPSSAKVAAKVPSTTGTSASSSSSSSGSNSSGSSSSTPSEKPSSTARGPNTPSKRTISVAMQRKIKNGDRKRQGLRELTDKEFEDYLKTINGSL